MDVLLAITDAFTSVNHSDARRVILDPVGPLFSAGHNFGEMKSTSRQSALELLKYVQT
jgi:enoyl-CoA hydratase/carnithine racemase